jgi:hypothetical protein
VGFVVVKVALGQVFIQVIPFSLVSIIRPLLHTHLSLPCEECDSSDQAAHYHTLSPKLGASSLTWHLAGNRKEVFLFMLKLGHLPIL